MLKKYKNDLPDFFEQHGFKSGDFTINESGFNTTLAFRESPMKFVITQKKDDFHQFVYTKTLFNPSFSLNPFNSKYLTFDGIKEHLEVWINNELSPYKFELDEPDQFAFWLNQHNKYVNIEGINFDSEESFKKNELEALKTGLLETKNLIIKEFNLVEAQQIILSERIQYLIDASNRAGTKTDWKNILISTILNLVVTLALDIDKSKQLWNLFGKVLNQMPQIGDIVNKISTLK